MNGQVTDYKMSAQEYRVNSFIQDMRDIDFGNGGVPTKLQDHLLRDKKAIEDIFRGEDCLFILPRSQQAAKYLYDVAMNECYDKNGSKEFPLADDISWCKFGDRYYLHLWWD